MPNTFPSNSVPAGGGAAPAAATGGSVPTPPKISTEFKGRYFANTRWVNGGNGAGANFIPTQARPFMPIADSTRHMMDIAIGDPYVDIGSNNAMQRWNFENNVAVWSKQNVAANDVSAYYYDVAGGRLWIAAGTAFISQMVDMNILTGAETPHTVTGSATSDFGGNGNLLHTSPHNIYRLESGNFFALWPETPGTTTIPVTRYREVSDTGVLVGSSSIAIDLNGVGTIKSHGVYISRDNTVLLDGMYVSSKDSRKTVMHLMRGGGTVKIAFNYDAQQMGNSEITDVNMNLQKTWHRVAVWGAETVMLTVDESVTSSRTLRAPIGQMMFDRTDFDRWLNDMADLYNMPPGVDLLSGLGSAQL